MGAGIPEDLLTEASSRTLTDRIAKASKRAMGRPPVRVSGSNASPGFVGFESLLDVIYFA